jgi:4-amino-4-deoxy-L-arabinose transferase-like glycosyltransferase
MLRKIGWKIAVSIVLAVIVLLPVVPSIQQTPGRDSGMFLYIGQQLLEGKTLYRDLWDHKPPLIFLVEVVGLALGSGGLWGIWALQLLFVSMAAFFCLIILTDVFGGFTGTAASVAALLTLKIVLHGGNLTEEYALPFQFGALVSFLKSRQSKNPLVMALFAGILVGLACMFKQNLIGVGAAIGAFLFLENLVGVHRRQWLSLSGLAAGFGLVMLGVAAYFFFTGTFADFWDAAFLYNASYSQLGLLERIQSGQEVIKMVIGTPGFLIALVGWLVSLGIALFYHAPTLSKLLRWRWLTIGMAGMGVVGLLAGLGPAVLSGDEIKGMGVLRSAAAAVGGMLLVFGLLNGKLSWGFNLSGWLRKNEFSLNPQVGVLISLTILWFPIELALIGWSGRNYLHYFMSLVPPTAVLLAILMDRLTRILPAQSAASWGIILLLCLGVAYQPLSALRTELKAGADPQFVQAARYLQENTETGQKVLSWGGDPLVNFLSGRSLPTRYVHMYPFYLPDYAAHDRAQKLFADILQNQPALILDTMNPDLPFVNLKDSGTCLQSMAGKPDELKPMFQYLCRRYVLAGWVGPEGWPVYRLNAAQ